MFVKSFNELYKANMYLPSMQLQNYHQRIELSWNELFPDVYTLCKISAVGIIVIASVDFFLFILVMYSLLVCIVGRKGFDHLLLYLIFVHCS